MIMAEKLLIYDGECGYCRGFVRLVRLLDVRNEIWVIPFDAPESQALLSSQFGSQYGFAMYLFERYEASWGQEAARRIIEGISLPRWMAKLAFYIYPTLVRLISKLTRRTRSVCGPDCIELANSSLRQQFAKIQNGALQQLRAILH